MTTEIVPFTPDHLDAAAALLAARQRSIRTEQPGLSARYTDPTETRPVVEQALANEVATGMVAIRDGRFIGYLIGYLIGEMVLPRPSYRPRAAWVDYAGHAVDVDDDDGGETYRSLYAALAPRWISRGSFAHCVIVPAHDQQALAAWHSLGFGQFHALGLRDTSPPAQRVSPPGIEIDHAGLEDAEPIVQMRRRLALHHTTSPIFEAYLPEEDAWFRTNTPERLADPETRILIAVRNSQPVGTFTVAPAGPRDAMAHPDRSLHIDEGFTESTERGGGVGSLLLDAALSEAREEGYEWCSVSWRTANLQANRFWRGNGFRPVYYRLLREIDPRIAWAKPES
ncbi:MAG: N-acetyltransferase family protein [Dehalococcoidia bacterium]